MRTKKIWIALLFTAACLPAVAQTEKLITLSEAIALARTQSVDAADFEAQYQRIDSSREASANLNGLTLEEIERRTILHTLQLHNGNLSQVAIALGISRAALYRRLEKYGISVNS